MGIEKKYFGVTSVWAPMLLVQFQNRSGIEIEHGITCLFPSQIGSSIPTFGDIHLHLLVSKNFSLQLLAWFSPAKSNAEN